MWEPSVQVMLAARWYMTTLFLQLATTVTAKDSVISQQCVDDSAALWQQLQIDCRAATALQLCRNTLAARRCIDDDASLRRDTAIATDCASAVAISGCTSNPVVPRWCPKSCSICPITLKRSADQAIVRKLCPLTCGLCPGTGRRDCIGEWGPWSSCIACSRQRTYEVLRAEVGSGMACPFQDAYVENQDCCGQNTRWRLVAASAVPSFWEVRRIKFFEDHACSDTPVTVHSTHTAQPGMNHTLLPTTGSFQTDPARPSSTICIDCCTSDQIGPISSGSAPEPYGCESALMRDYAEDNSWRSLCSPCAPGEAWLGFRTEGDPVNIKCVRVVQNVKGAAGAVIHAPTRLRVERWSGATWEPVAESDGAGHEYVDVRVRRARLLQVDTNWAIGLLLVLAAAISATIFWIWRYYSLRRRPKDTYWMEREATEDESYFDSDSDSESQNRKPLL
mmetsp:Transcript_84337/g.139604  ORF Transcript_84337/g.139604 Transcript_84337/m.139604 type:complete len:449 (+) Transcript_84337:78-1424(+)